jgi:hypothetical protein
MQVELKGETITFSEEDFNINEDNVDGELCRSGNLLCFYGNLAAELKGLAVNNKSDLETWDAETSLKLRSEAEVSGKKLTEGRVREMVVSNPDRRGMQQRYIKAETDYQKAENLFRSQQKKADCVISLAYKQRTEISKGAY